MSLSTFARRATGAAWGLFAACSASEEATLPARSDARPPSASIEPTPAAPPGVDRAPSGPSPGPGSVVPAPAPPALIVPAAVVTYLSAKPYVEERCELATPPRAGAERCRYSVLGLDAQVTVLNPSAERVGRWIVDAARASAPFAELEAKDPAAWERVLLTFAKHVRHQSSRIFPLSGDIVEDLGAGPTAYRFDRGVVTPCDKGRCRCRINSLTPRAYCRYREHLGDVFEACTAKYDGAVGDEAWRAQCVANHEASLDADRNDHFRAKALVVGRAVDKRCAGTCEPPLIVTYLEKELGLAR